MFISLSITYIKKTQPSWDNLLSTAHPFRSEAKTPGASPSNLSWRKMFVRIHDTVDGWNPANQLIGSFSHYL